MKYLRIGRISRQEKIRNVKIREDLKTQTIFEFIEMRSLTRLVEPQKNGVKQDQLKKKRPKQTWGKV